MRKYWNRWVYASVTKHFAEVANDNNLYAYVAGRSDDTGETNSFLETRVSGLHTTEISKNNFKVEVNIDVTFSVHIVPENTHRAEDVAGALEVAFDDICIYKYGNQSYDDGTILGTLRIQRQPTESNSFGQVSEDTRIIQGVVSATLQMVIKE
jgi:hypothetical protein